MKRVLVLACLVVTASACGSNSNSPTTPSTNTSTPTKIISLSGNMDFGSIQIGQSFSATLTIRNTGTATLTISGLTGSNGIANVIVASWTGGTISAGGSQDVVFRFSPTAAQTYTGTLTVNGDQTSGTNTIQMTGTGSTAGLPHFSLVGTVREKTTGKGIAGITVQVTSGLDSGMSTRTDSTGYVFGSLTTGTFTVQAGGSGYLSSTNSVTLSANGVSDFSLNPTPPSVEYRITGNARRCSATYQNSTGGTNQSEVNIPFSYSWNNARSGDFLYMSCQIDTGGDNGSITVTIYKDGSSYRSAMANGFPNIATASGTY